MICSKLGRQPRSSYSCYGALMGFASMLLLLIAVASSRGFWTSFASFATILLFLADLNSTELIQL